MKLPYWCFALAILTACTNSSTENKNEQDSLPADTPAQQAEITHSEHCYLHLAGTSGQDTTSLRLVLHGDEAQGELNWIPAEKDARKGMIRGSRKGDIITGTWVFMQEGMTDSLPVEFKLANGKVFQKSYSFNQSTGKEYLEPNADFDQEFVPAECNK